MAFIRVAIAGLVMLAGAAIEQPAPPPAVTRRPAFLTKPGAPTVRKNSRDGLKYVWIPPGTFIMGCSPGDNECRDREKPAHQVTITKGFWIGQTPVTAVAYRRFADATRRPIPPYPEVNRIEYNDNPMVYVNWFDAQAYCGWIGGRLPTEAEWEYAARGGNTEARYGKLDQIAWYSENSWNRAQDVGQKRPNAFGLYDTAGNVLQWVNDWYGRNYYRTSPLQDPQGPETGHSRVLRGGFWGSLPSEIRVSNRTLNYPAGRNYYNSGFRCSGGVFGP